MKNAIGGTATNVTNVRRQEIEIIKITDPITIIILRRKILRFEDIVIDIASQSAVSLQVSDMIFQ